jgi:mannose-6-phosphate isomerase
MCATSLSARPVEKIWGRRDVPGGFGAAGGSAEPIGEIWFEAERGREPDLLVKYLFTSQRLSIQVHPDDAAARAVGGARGKDEAWLVLDAEPGATIGLGLKRDASAEEVRAAALDGSIEQLIHWKPVAAGDFIYSPAGTVHAIGAGLSLIEVQQNSDTTYRLYDYGRPRELHLDAALQVARLEPWSAIYSPRHIGEGRELLATGAAFTVERWRGDAALGFGAGADELMLIPIAGAGEVDGEALQRASVLAASRSGVLRPSGMLDVLVAYNGPVRLNLVRREDRRRPARTSRTAG